MSRRRSTIGLRAAEAAFRLVLRLHPSAFRRRYQHELVACFREGWADEVHGRGGRAAIWFLAQQLGGVVDTVWRQRLGGPTRSAQGTEGGGTTMMLEGVLQDLRLAVRRSARRAGSTAVVVLTLGLGMAVTTAVFAVLNAVLLAPLPYAEGERLVRIYHRNVLSGSDRLYLSAPGAAELRDAARSFDAVAILENYSAEGATLGGTDRPERVRLLRVGAGYFGTLGTQPLVGRFFGRADETPETRVVVLSEHVWETRLGADPDVVGRSIELNGEAYSVVGVAPSVRDPLSGAIDLWLPARLADAASAVWDNNYLSGMARLAEGVTLEMARDELDGLARAHAGLGEAAEERAYTVVPLRDDLVGDVRPLLGALMGAVAFLLLLTCSNVASLMLARAAVRERELAIRASLGSGRWTLVRGSAVEALLLALLAGVAGLVLSGACLRALLAVAPADLPLRETIGLGGGVVGFAAVLAGSTAAVLGLATSLPSARREPGRGLGEAARSGQGGRRAARLRAGLVLVDMALAVVLLVGAGLLFRTLGSLRARDLGVDPAGVVAFQVDLPEIRYGDAERRIRFQNDLLARLAATPGFEHAGSTSHLPVSGSRNTWGVRPASVDGTAAEVDNLQVNQRIMDGDYFAAVGGRLLAGRTFGPDDGADAPHVVVVSRSTARRVLGDVDPIGRRLAVGPFRPTVVGLVEDVAIGARLDPAPIVYHPYDQFGAERRWPTIYVVRAAPGVVDPWAPIRAVVAAIDPALVVHGTVRLDDVVGQDIATERFASLLLRVFAALAVLVAALGLYGVLAHAVERRRHEIGVHLALGADSARVRGRVLRDGIRLAMVGTGLGLVLAFPLARGIAFLVYGVSPWDATVFLSIPALLVVVALGSSWLPARSASRVSPMELLRAE